MPKVYLTYIFLLSAISLLVLSFFIDQEFFKFFSFSFSGGLLISACYEYFKKKRFFFTFIFIALILASMTAQIRIETLFEEKPKDHIIYSLNQFVNIEGKIISEADIRSNHVKYIVDILKKDNQKAVGRILLNAPVYPSFVYGDILFISGKLQEAKKIDDFSYKNYLSRYEIYGTMSYADIKKIEYKPDSNLLSWLYQKKQKFLTAINSQYSEPQASFLAGLLIGARKGMSEEITKEFQITGLSHIVAVSGSNITMLLAVILTLIAFLPRFIAMGISIVSIVVFTVFVGMSAAVVRAAIMGIIALFAIQSGRPHAPFMALLLTSFIMTMYQPKILVYDVGFQLSIAAVIGVIWLVPLFPKFFQNLPEQFGVKEAVALTLAAQITTLPISVFHFHAFSIIAPLANLAVIPLIPFIMLFGFFSLLPIPFISEILSFITYKLLSLSLFFAHTFSSIPFSQITEINISFWILGIYIFILVVFLIKYSNNQPEPRQISPLSQSDN